VLFAEVMNEADGRSKGCGIVEYATADEAKEAIKMLTDSELKGRMIFVREDRETTPTAPPVGGGTFHPVTRHHPGAGTGAGGFSSVYVGNLAYETSWQDLKDHMRQAGNVDQANILTNEDGRSKGCGIVQYQRPQDAARAVRELQNSVLDGRPIFLREDRENSGAGGGGAAPRGSRGGGGGSQLYVGNLSSETTWKDLKDHFRQCGDVERAEVVDGKKRGSAFGTVRFFKDKDAQTAIRRLNGVELHGNKLEVRNDYRAN
jgi:RNA recognition motif-containing protein